MNDPDLLTEFFIEERSKMANDDKRFENLKNAVIKLLVSDHDYSMDDAEEAVSESVNNNSDVWHVDADANDLAKYLASGEDDD